MAFLPMLVGDSVRWVLDVVIHAVTLAAGAGVFVWLWRMGPVGYRVAAFPAAVATVAGAFPLIVIIVALLLVRKVSPGTYDLRKPEARRWIMAESLMLLVHRSFLRGTLEDFVLPRHLFYRILGARIHRSFFMGGEARILDPWVLDAGPNVVVGAFSVVCGHAIEGNTLLVKPVKLGRGATVGVRCVILPGADIGENAIIGAGAVVTKDTHVPANEIWAGVPARKIGER